MRRPFRIVQLSDLHLTRRDDAARSEPNVFRPLRGMNAAFRGLVRSKVVQGADLVLATGDITDRGDLHSWQVFWSAIRDTGLLERTLVIPGNHDVCCLGLRLPNRGAGYRAADLDKAIAGLRLGGQPTRFPWVRRVDPRIAVYGLNSNNLGNMGVHDNAMGALGYHQLAQFARDLAKHGDAPVKIVALHHSPNIPAPDTARRRGIDPMGPLAVKGHQVPRDQRQAMRLLCITHRVRLVVHGHLHRAEDRRVDGVRIVGVPASTQPVHARKLHGEYVVASYTIQGEGGRVTRRWHTVRC